jgi:hypothetical protein
MKLITIYRAFQKHRETLHSVALHAAVISLTCIVISMWEPMTGEILNGMMVQIGTIISLTLAACGAITVLSLFLWNFGKGVTVRVVMDADPVTRLLGPGTWTAPDIAPDRLICSLPGESPADFARRAEAAINEAKPEKWVVVIRFRDPVGMIYSSLSHFREFKRSEPPFLNTGAASPEDYMYSKESEKQYKSYCDWFAEHFREWSPVQKVTGDDNPGLLFRRMLAAGLFALLMMFAPSLTAQTNVEQLRGVLEAGHLANDVPKQGSEIIYSFAHKEYERRGNGRSNYVDLLTGVPNFREGNVGAFESMTVNGKVIATQTRRAVVSALPVEDEGFAMPDSVGLAERLQESRDKFDFYKSQFWLGVRPTWETIMYIFMGVLPLLIIPLFVLKFWTRLFAAEELPEYHYKASKALTILIGSIVTMFVINAMMLMIFAEWNFWGVTFCSFFVYWLASFAASWFVPNLKSKPGGRTAFMPGNYNNRQLPG